MVNKRVIQERQKMEMSYSSAQLERKKKFRSIVIKKGIYDDGRAVL